MNFWLVQFFMLLVSVFFSGSVMANGLFSLSVGHEQTSGTYGSTSETKIGTTSLLVGYSINAWRFSLFMPLVSVTGDGSVIPSSSGTGSGYGNNTSTTTTTTVVETQSGFGDIMPSLSYAFFPKKGSYMFHELTAEVKIGTASVSDNLGNGENDLSLSLYNAYEKYDMQPFLTFGYLLLGDTDTVDFNDVLFVTTGFTYHMNSKTSFGVVYDYQQASVDGEDDGAILEFNLSKQFNQQWSARVYSLTGLSDSVAESGIGLSLKRNF